MLPAKNSMRKDPAGTVTLDSFEELVCGKKAPSFGEIKPARLPVSQAPLTEPFMDVQVRASLLGNLLIRNSCNSFLQKVGK